MAERGIGPKELAKRVGITPVDLLRIKTNKSSSARFSTFGALCDALDCGPGDLLECVSDAE